MNHIIVTSLHLAELNSNAGMAWINADSNQLMVVIDGDLHILLGNFTHIETAKDLNHFIQDHFAN